MAIYKVHIKTDGDKTIYSTNGTTLATVSYNPATDKWDISAPTMDGQTATQEEADKAVRESITVFFATTGLSPNFTKD